MALKDWKKVESTKQYILYVDEDLEIEELSVEKIGNSWFFIENDKHNSPTRTRVKSFRVGKLKLFKYMKHNVEI